MHPKELDAALGEGWITEVIRAVKSGKEASVYLCRGSDRSGAELVAAKVYRARPAFHNNSGYWEGGTRGWKRSSALAVEKRSAFGREVRFNVWIGRELEHLRALHMAGAAVPRPIAQEGSALLLAWIGDEDGAAPPLRSVRLERGAAAAAAEELLKQVELFLAHDLVHGDLSEYNVLWWDGHPTVIDFPQAVDPRFNRGARSLLERDLRNLAGYFARSGVEIDWRRRSGELWNRWLNSELGTEETPSADDWNFWKQFV